MESTLKQRAIRPVEFMRMYGIGHTKMYQLIESGDIVVRKCGKATLIDFDEAERWYQSLETGVAGVGCATPRAKAG